MDGLGPVVADRDLGGAGPWGTVLAAVGVGALLGSLAATRVRPSRPLVFVALMDALFGLPLAFLAAGTSAPILALGGLLSGVGLMLGMSVWETTLQREIPAESLSRVASYDWFVSYAVYPIGLAIWGPLAGMLGIQTALWLAFGIFFASVLALLSGRRRPRRQLQAHPCLSQAGSARLRDRLLDVQRACAGERAVRPRDRAQPTGSLHQPGGWGLHLTDADIALGQLANLVRRQLRAYD